MAEPLKAEKVLQIWILLDVLHKALVGCVKCLLEKESAIGKARGVSPVAGRYGELFAINPLDQIPWHLMGQKDPPVVRV